jgi:DNA polymerase III alpha subunit
MKQATLDSFFQPTQKERPNVPNTQSIENAKDVLEPLFIRPIPDQPKYRIQLEEEYELIDKNKFTPVFLQVRTVLELIRVISEESGEPIIHIIRGSAGSSLVCYLLGITHIDPILHGIQLARFMNTNRKDMPDIDIDVPYNRREEIFGRIATTWPGMVARISNYCMWSTKTALRESVKEILREQGESIPSALNRKKYDIQSILGHDAQRIQKANELASEKNGKLRNYSKHCGGIVIFEKEQEVPEDLILQPIQADGKPLVQIKLNKDDTEKQGFIKIDLLSNRGLAQLVQICPDRPLTVYPSRDAATERIFEKGWNIGITFGESRGMRKLFMEMKPRNVKDIAVALALIRPAAAAEGRKQEFLEKWKVGKVDDPLARPIIYDDDAICKVRRALGCDPAEADMWRKAFAKGNARARVDFRQRMYELGHSSDITNSVIDDLNQLIYYSFCKSHAFSYAQLVWALAYWKAHRPHDFWASALNHCHSEYRKWVHYREARCSGLHLSRSKPPYKVGIRQGVPYLVSSYGEQTILAELDPVKEYREFGYWTSEAFLPTCGIWMDSQQRLDKKKTCTFRGLIATGRTITRDWGKCTLVCLGVDNRKYIDLVFPEKHRSDLFSWAVLEGAGILTKPDTVEVTKIHGISLSTLLQNQKRTGTVPK